MHKRKASGYVLGSWRLWEIGVCHGQLKPQGRSGKYWTSSVSSPSFGGKLRTYLYRRKRAGHKFHNGTGERPSPPLDPGRGAGRLGRSSRADEVKSRTLSNRRMKGCTAPGQ